MEILGFEITRKKNELRSSEDLLGKSFVPPSNEDGVAVLEQQTGYVAGGAVGAYIDMEGVIKSEIDLIRKYREIALIPECDSAIEDIVNECITSDVDDTIVDIDLSKTKLSESIKKKVHEEFQNILTTMKFNQHSHELFRKWYIDGRIYFHKVVDPQRPKRGIIDIRFVDPTKIKKIRNVEREKDKVTGMDLIKNVEEFYAFNEKGIESNSNAGQAIKIAPELLHIQPLGYWTSHGILFWVTYTKQSKLQTNLT